MSIANECMIVNLQIGVWEGKRLDKEASRDVTNRAGAEEDAARVNKHLIPKDKLKAVTKAQGALRLHFYDRTVPWKDNGDRLLTRKLYLKFIEEHEKLMNDFRDAVEEFITKIYPACRDQAEFRMGSLFRHEDYPPAESLRYRFYANMQVDVVTTGKDFRLDMDEKHVASIRKDMERELGERSKAATMHVYKRVLDELTHYHEVTSDPEKVFRNSTVEKLEDLIDILPGLNIADDPDLNAVIDQMKDTLSGRSPDDLRNNSAERSAAAKATEEVLDVMKGFMNTMKAAA